MIWGRVTGVLWASRKDERLVRSKLLLIEPYAWYEPFAEIGHMVAVDSLDAGPGDDVVVCIGTPARVHAGGLQVPVDAAVMAIVDRAQLDRSALEHHRPFTWLGPPPERLTWSGS